MTLELDPPVQKVKESNLEMMGLIDSEETMRTYLRLSMLWGKELAIELTRIIKSIRYLRNDLEKIREDVDELKTHKNNAEKGVAYD